MARIPSQELPNEKEIDALMNQLSNEGLLLNLHPEMNHGRNAPKNDNSKFQVHVSAPAEQTIPTQN